MYNSSFMTVINRLHELSEPAPASHLIYMLVLAYYIQETTVFGIFHHNIDPGIGNNKQKQKEGLRV